MILPVTTKPTCGPFIFYHVEYIYQIYLDVHCGSEPPLEPATAFSGGFGAATRLAASDPTSQPSGCPCTGPGPSLHPQHSRSSEHYLSSRAAP